LGRSKGERWLWLCGFSSDIKIFKSSGFSTIFVSNSTKIIAMSIEIKDRQLIIIWATQAICIIESIIHLQKFSLRAENIVY
jgi:hypothetical protein